MAAYKAAVGMVLTEIVDSDDEKPKKPCQRKIMECIKRRESDYFQHIFQELKVEHRMYFKDIFDMSFTDCKSNFQPHFIK